MVERFNAKFRCFAFVLLFIICFAFVGFSRFEEQIIDLDELQVDLYEVKYCNYEVSDRIEESFFTTYYKPIKDFTLEYNYLACYDENLNYYAIINRDSGDIIERSSGRLPYVDYDDYICYYGGIHSYFYQDANDLHQIGSDFVISLDCAKESFYSESKSLYEASLAESVYKSREEIVNYSKTIDEFEIVLCGEANRSRQTFADNMFYNMSLIDVNYYLDSSWTFYSFPTFELRDDRIGFNTFYTYDGIDYNDLIFPININGTCGIVGATMLLQYYERNRILRTVPTSFYVDAYQNFHAGWRINTWYNDIVTARVYNAINSFHNVPYNGSTFVSIKSAINSYIEANSLSGFSATSSLGTASLKGCIDGGDPALIFVSACTLYRSYLDGSNYEPSEVGFDVGHVLYTYGYTKSKLGIVDEYICNSGWCDNGTVYTNGITFVSKTAIRGNVRILY